MPGREDDVLSKAVHRHIPGASPSSSVSRSPHRSRLTKRGQREMSALRALNASVQAKKVSSTISSMNSEAGVPDHAPHSRPKARRLLTEADVPLHLPRRAESSAAGRRRMSQCTLPDLPLLTSSLGKVPEEEPVAVAWLPESCLAGLPEFGLTIIASYLQAAEWRVLSQMNKYLRFVFSQAFSMATLKTHLVQRGRVRLIRRRLIAALSARMRRVTHIKVAGTLMPQSVDAFAAGMPVWHRMEVLELRGTMVDDDCLLRLCEYLPQCPRLASLDLCKNMVRDEGAEQLAATLPKCPAMEQVVLSDNYIEDRGVVVLARAVAHTKLMWSFHVDGNRHTSRCGPWVMEALQEAQGRLVDVSF